MAAASISVEQDQFSCSICLDLLKDPVTIPCGHSYCMGCIKGCWDHDDQTGVYSCPQCRQTFAPRPVLGRNTMLAEVVEKVKKTGLQAAPPAHCYAGPGDVTCDVCTGRKRKAVKSCLECLASYCETDLVLHDKLNRGKSHKLIEATAKLQEQICSRHCKLLEVYCRTDQQCICLLCVMNEHRGHDTVSSAAERNEKQKELGETQRKFQHRIQEREKELQDLRQAVESLTRSAQAAVEDSERIFTELIRSIERRRSEVKELIRDQEKAAVSQAEGVMERLELEIAELRRRDAEMEQLSHTEDHIHFLQSCRSLCVPPGCGDLSSITINPHVSFGFVNKSVSELKERLEDVCKEKLAKISLTVKNVHLLKAPEPRTRAEFLQYSCQLTLDPNTANTHLCLSEGNRAVTCGTVKQPYPDHPERFEKRWQVLCREGLSGRCYWEAEWRQNMVYIAVSYKEISRKAKSNDCVFGCNEKSWRLRCSASEYSFWHNRKSTDTPVPPSSRIGVYLDHRAGTLSFYSVSDTMTLLHRVHTTFTQPLYPGFWLDTGSTVKLCPLE
ncbi:tripartite motif-containing protein 16-like isoform X1 [Megalops cyprinoides]|uniref:tripartite motif-containing protein 16-like isoform X1 n=1 Tax=Megalops cyprinoides TaxID=118141 RepID=UPI00186469C3|nr:tripartite motif-containing protein 16-like isoform X1 [Megalops cyprinoides]